MIQDFETHLTLDLGNGNADDYERARLWCAEKGLKWTHILLACGQSPSQPMLTRWNRGTWQDEQMAARTLVRECEAAGLAVARVKIEVAAQNALDFASTSGYFEQHIKLLIPSAAILEELQKLAIGAGAHLSRNARRQRNDGTLEHFVTQRFHGDGAHFEAAQSQFASLVDQLKSNGFSLLEAETEFVVYDSNLHLDAGWLEN